MHTIGKLKIKIVKNAYEQKNKIFSRHSPVCVLVHRRKGENEGNIGHDRGKTDRQMHAVGQESKYRGLVHPFATPLVPFILSRLTRPLAESILPRISFRPHLHVSPFQVREIQTLAFSRWTKYFPTIFPREPPFILSRFPIRGKGDKDSVG